MVELDRQLIEVLDKRRDDIGLSIVALAFDAGLPVARTSALFNFTAKKPLTMGEVVSLAVVLHVTVSIGGTPMVQVTLGDGAGSGSGATGGTSSVAR